MPHQHHFLSRLDRISPRQTEFALSLYRDDDLMKFLLQNVQVPETEDRFAVSIGDPVRGPFIIVDRNGHFVTCLGEGMGIGNRYLITRAQLDAVIRRRNELASRSAVYEEVRRLDRDGKRLFGRMFGAGEHLCREDFVALTALAPYLRTTFMKMGFEGLESLAELRDRSVRTLRRARGPARHLVPLLRTYHEGHWASSTLLLLSCIDIRENLPFAGEELAEGFVSMVRLLGFGLLTVSSAIRSLMATATLGPSLLQLHRRAYAKSERFHEMLESAASLALMGVKFPGLARQVSSVLAAPNHFDSHAVADDMRRMMGWVRTASLGVLSDPEEWAAMHRRTGAERAVALAVRRRPRAPRYAKVADVPPHVADAVAAQSPAWFLGCSDRFYQIFAAIPFVARSESSALFLPRAEMAELRLRWKPAQTVTLIGAFSESARNAARAATTEHAAGPFRKRPCPCGSGLKYKRCCAAAPPVAPAPVALAVEMEAVEAAEAAE